MTITEEQKARFDEAFNLLIDDPQILDQIISFGLQGDLEGALELLNLSLDDVPALQEYSQGHQYVVGELLAVGFW